MAEYANNKTINMKRGSTFQKFSNRKSNASIKEDARKVRRESKRKAREYFEEKKAREKAIRHGGTVPEQTKVTRKELFPMQLNKFLAHCGVASRRESADIVKEGRVKVNDTIVKEPGHRINKTDIVHLDGNKLSIQTNLVYILINKPKDFITTTSDPRNRKTVMNLIEKATQERVYPIGRLDRNTTGILLMTNDGDLTQKLTHPSFKIKKIYEVKLDKPLEMQHFDAILSNVELEDGPVQADALAFPDNHDHHVVGIEIHSGRNRIVRRIFEHFGYEITSLDRVLFAGLTKKDVLRGKWRFLNEKEIKQIKKL